MSRNKRIKQIVNFYRIIIAYIIIITNNRSFKDFIYDEMYYWNKCCQLNLCNKIDILSILLMDLKEYRSLLIYRMRKKSLIKSILLKIIFPPLDSLYITTKDIGPRMFIQHGFSTIISAKKIGSDCWINQQVTIGWDSEDEPPTIGNGVRICAGAKVIGKIKIGNNVTIGANAVVVKDVIDNKIVAGVPAKIIKDKNKLEKI